MACTKCKNNRCGCADSALTIGPNFSNDPTVCPPDSETCVEVFDMACICWQGPDMCELDIKAGDRLDEVVQKLVLTLAQVSCNTNPQPTQFISTRVYFQDSGAAQGVPNTIQPLTSGDLAHTIASGGGGYRITTGFNFRIQPQEVMQFDILLNGAPLNNETFEKYSTTDDNYQSFSFMKELSLTDGDTIAMAFGSPNDVVVVNSYLLIEKIS